MARSARLLILLLTVAVVGGLEEFHAHFVGHYPFTQLPRFAWLVVFVALIWITTYAVGLPDDADSGGQALVRAMIALGTSAGVVSLAALLAASPLLPRFVVLTSAALLAPLDAGVAVLARQGQHRAGEAERVLAIVEPVEAATLASELRREPEHHAALVATCTPAEASQWTAGGAATAGAGEKGDGTLANLVAERGVTLVVLDRAAQSDDTIVLEVAALHRSGTRVRTLSLFYDEWLGKLPVAELERVSLLFDIHELHRPMYPHMKRTLDVALAVPGVMMFLAAVPFVALADVIANRGPLLFRQQRVGRDGEVFTILKFRTMTPATGEALWTADDDVRLGRVGRWMRRTHLDELPQFWNVLRRDLSVVGPRPEQPRYVAELAEKIPYYELRHLVRPGITGWAQVKYGYGGSDLDALEKLQYEFYYLRHQSFLLDLRIIGRTLRSIAGRKGR